MHLVLEPPSGSPGFLGQLPELDSIEPDGIHCLAENSFGQACR